MYKNKYLKYKNKYLKYKNKYEKKNHFGGNDINSLFNIDIDLLQKTNFFSNLHNYKQNIRQIGMPSSNGFINQLTYEDDGIQYSIVLKSNLNMKSDNLVYEYLVGQCINHFAIFYPCFSKTFQICKYNSEEDIILFKESREEIILPKTFDKYFTKLDPYKLEELIINGCKFNNLICIFMQYIPIWISISDYVSQIEQVSDLYIIVTIFHLLYSCLSNFANFFTHHDLNINNVVLVKIPNDQYVIINIHLIDGKVISYKTNIIPVIIDYGLCFVDCSFEESLSLFTSLKIKEIVCNHDNKTDNICPDICGNNVGFKFIDRHMSRDLILLSAILPRISGRINIKRAILKKNDYIDKTLQELPTKILPHSTITPEGSYFLNPENLDEKTDKFYNVHSAFHIFTEIVNNCEFKQGNEAIFQSSTLYKTIDIWYGRFDRPFTIS